MSAVIRHHSPPSAVPATPGEADAVLAQARALLQARGTPGARPLLRGKKLGLYCSDPASEPARLFREAALELGAHVSHLPLTLGERSDAREIAHTARVLGKLYDAVECISLPPAIVEALRDDAGIPVYGGLATATHPSAALAERLDAAATPDDRRRALVQALLMASIG